ncbi:MAG: hypothetical protein COT25_02365 [Candidatus Kerfeldbacteria bacterium CG08_land_8_20_14_0_20_42_7]|uniref:Prepilin-type N-terminal cleavage/methylation domain-containing protein n=1 Tax=Candidatus Kerfeldbacteria bacterium CG08_land_8_20_14_0_20_42_7 TaxID=2014245 RepID=A0A2H0YTG6_9BACT|nr:MAG: hypothetical protein COT25_02365 [Candidatus Kerfeldbacteria bacterium CG08_land_8_20_14_0_20_42_7]
MLPKQGFQNRKGLTLVELLVSIGIIAIVMVIMVTILASQNSSFQEESIRNKLATDQTQALNDIQYNLISGSEIQASYTDNGITYTTDENTVVIAMPTIDAIGDPVANQSDMYIIDKPTASSLMHILLITDPQSGRLAQDKTAITNVSDLVIRYDNEDPTVSKTFSITLEVSQVTGKSRVIKSLQTVTYDLRNA